MLPSHRELRGLGRALSLALAPLLIVGCLDEGQPLGPSVERVAEAAEPTPGPNGHDSFSRVASALETEAAPMMDEASLEACADAGNLCFERGQDAITCIDTYVDCVVVAGMPADHPYLVCLESLSSCWSTAGEDQTALDTCFDAYDLCLGEALPEASTPPDDPEPVDPEPVDPADAGEAALLACEDEASSCLGSAMDGAEYASCTATYRDCVVGVGVSPDEPYVLCLDDAVACLGDGTEPCWDLFEACVEQSYPYDEDPGADPGGNEPEEPETAVCEEPVYACYEDGGSNAECIGAYRTCLLGEGWSADDAEILCLDTLVACVGPAEGAPDPDAALDACADAFNTCIGYPAY